MPPSQLEIAFQSRSERGIWDVGIVQAPVVVQPDTDSKILSYGTDKNPAQKSDEEAFSGFDLQCIVF